MPIYEFNCEDCKQTFEEIVRMSDEDCPPCPACGSKKTRRVLSLFQSAAKGAGGSKSFCGPSSGGFS